MLNLKDKLTQFFRDMIPTRRVTIYDPRQSPTTIATSMSPDAVQQIFASAQTGSVRDLFTLYRDILIADSHSQTQFNTRKIAVLGDVLSIQPEDKKVAADVQAADFIRSAIADVPGWIRACSYLLHSTLWPVAILEKVFAPSPTGYRLARLVPVPYELLDYSMGYLRIWYTHPELGTLLGTAHVPSEDRYVIHRGHLLEIPDNWGGPMRSIVFWWLLGAMDRDWWSQFLDKYGAPFLVGKYDQGDDTSRSVLERAFRMAVKLGGLVVSRETEVELKQASATDSGEAYEKFLSICQREKSKLILGQTLSADAQATGMGSGVADQQEGVRQDIRQFDAMSLGLTLRDQVAVQLLRINGIPGRVKFVWGGESTAEQANTGTLLKGLFQSGIELTDEGITSLGERLGLPLRRAAAKAPMPLSRGILPLATTFDAEVAVDDIARAGSAELVRAFRGSLAPVRRLIALSRSPEELERSLRQFYPDYPVDRQARLIEEALIAYTANGATGGATVNE